MARVKDVPEVEESVEESKDDISADVLNAMSEAEDEKPEVQEPNDVEDEPAEELADEDGGDEGEESDDDDTIVELAPDGDLAASEESEDHITPPEHWSAVDKEKFTAVPKEAQEFILERHKSMEGDYTRKSQEIASVRRQYEAVQDALSPYRSEFAASGLDDAGAVRQLAHWHQALKTGGKAAVLSLAQTYGIDLDEESEYTDPALSSIQQELRAIKEQTHRQTQEAQRQQQDQLFSTIEAFRDETDATGKLLHPHFEELQGEMTALFQLPEAYRPKDLKKCYEKALLMSPNLTQPKPAVTKIITKVDKAEQVKKAKKAATGVKSSGAVGKKSREGMTLEQEIASLL